MTNTKKSQPMFQKRHYESVAKLINEVLLEVQNSFLAGLLVGKFVVLFRDDNDLFDKQKFYDACTRGIHGKEEE